MRNLDLYQVKEKLSELVSDIEISECKFLHQRIVQFWNFINTQPILKNILDRIAKDFSEVLELAERTYSGREGSTYNYLIKIQNREEQGVFNLLLIRKAVEITNQSYPEIQIIERFYHKERQYSDSKDNFIELVFKPFIELINWYLEDKKSDSVNDYFTINEITDINNKLDEILEKLKELKLLPLGQEIIYNEVDELKDMTKDLKKKNWLELLKGKFMDMVVSRIISFEAFKFIISTLTGEELKFLDN